VVLKFSPWGQVAVVFCIVFKFGYQTIWFLTLSLLFGMRFNGGDVIAYALGNFLPFW
jgi:hypothetical protein